MPTYEGEVNAGQVELSDAAVVVRYTQNAKFYLPPHAHSCHLQLILQKFTVSIFLTSCIES